MRQSLSEYDDRDEGGFSLVGEHRADEAPPPPRDRRLPKMLLTAGAMAVFAGGLWFAYVQGTHHAGPSPVVQSDGVPLLRPDAQPTKVKPDQPGGMAVPNQNVSLYNDKPGGAAVEKLLPAPEQPMPRPVAPPAAAPQAVIPASPLPGTVPAEAPAAKPAPVGKTAAKPAAPAKPAATPAKPVATPAKPAAASAVAATKTAPASAAKTGPIQVRLGSLRSPEAARDEWGKLKRENADILGKLSANAVRTELGDKGIYYRIEAGPFADAAAAERLCSEMKRRSLGCILAR